MEAGAIGVSTALIYPPAVYATTEEIAALAEVAGPYGGGYYTHMRNEGDRLLEAIDEALAIGRRGKHAGPHLSSQGGRPAKLGQDAAGHRPDQGGPRRGPASAADIYPYINNGLGIAAFIHPRHSAEGQAAPQRGLDDPAARAEIRHEMETTAGWENWFRHVGPDWNKVVIGQTKATALRASSPAKSLAAIAEGAARTRGTPSSRSSRRARPPCPRA